MPQRVAVVTGGGSGIGAETAALLAERGDHVIVADRDGEAADRGTCEIRKRNWSAQAELVDVGDHESIGALFGRIDSSLGRCDILVNNAGVSQVRQLLDFPDELFTRTIEINLTGTFRCSQRAARLMVKRGWGRIVNISSISGL